MDYVQIQRFLAIVKHLNLSEASKELYISQPALSLSLSSMEKELGLKLFYRVRNGLILTPEGEQLLEQFQGIKSAFDALNEKKEQIQQKEECFITLGCMGNSLLYSSLFMTDILSCKDHIVQAICADRETILQMLKNGLVDFAITSPALEGHAVGNINLFREDIVLVTSANHPLAHKGGLKLAQLRNEKFYALNRTHHFRRLCDRLCREKGFDPQYAFEGNYLGLYKEIVRQRSSDNYIAFCASESVEALYGDSYVVHELTDVDFTQSTVLTFMADRKLQYEYADFVNHIVEKYPVQRMIYEKIVKSIMNGLSQDWE